MAWPAPSARHAPPGGFGQAIEQLRGGSRNQTARRQGSLGMARRVGCLVSLRQALSYGVLSISVPEKGVDVKAVEGCRWLKSCRTWRVVVRLGCAQVGCPVGKRAQSLSWSGNEGVSYLVGSDVLTLSTPYGRDVDE